jgi:glycosyltransferase involved in cell wall biosynthesis
MFGRRFLRAALNNADALLVSNPTVARLLTHQADRVRVWAPFIPNLFNLEFTEEAPTPRYALFIGTVEPRKNIAYLERIAEALSAARSDITIRIAGRLGWGSRPPEPRPNLKYLGYLPDDRLAPQIQGASLFITASGQEGLGLPILEVGYAGLPSAIFREAIPREVCAEPAITLSGCPVRDATAVMDLIGDDQAMRTARHNARNMLTAWNAEAERTHALLLQELRLATVQT